MKKYASLLSLIAAFLSGSAQDTLFRMDNSKMLVKVLEIDPEVIRYKKFDFQEGPTYVDKKSEYKMIIYSTGLKETFAAAVMTERNTVSPAGDYYSPVVTGKIEQYGAKYRFNNATLSEREVHKILLKTMDKNIIMRVGKAKDAAKLQYIGFAAIPLGISALALFSNSIYINPTTGTASSNSAMQAAGAVCLIGAISCPIASGIFKKNRARHNREAVELYNQRH